MSQLRTPISVCCLGVKMDPWHTNDASISNMQLCEIIYALGPGDHVITTQLKELDFGDLCFNWELQRNKRIILVAPNAERVASFAFSRGDPFTSMLLSVELPACVEIGTAAFQNCEILETVVLPSLCRLGKGAFCDCIALKSIDISNGHVKCIEPDTFKGCAALVEVLLPCGLSHIGDRAFAGCSFATLSLPRSLNYIGCGTFKKNFSLREINIPPDVIRIRAQAFRCCTSLVRVLLSSDTDRIDDLAFQECSALTNIELPAALTQIGRSAFKACAALTTVELHPTRPLQMQQEVFAHCISLVGVSMSNLEFIEWGAFLGCTALHTVELPSNVFEMYGEAFKMCTALQNITIPGSLKMIGENAFLNCRALVEMTMPNVGLINCHAFRGCDTLKRVLIPQATYIGDGAFRGCTSLTTIDVGSGDIRGITATPFDTCTSLTNLKCIPANLPLLLEATNKSMVHVVLPTTERVIAATDVSPERIMLMTPNTKIDGWTGGPASMEVTLKFRRNHPFGSAEPVTNVSTYTRLATLAASWKRTGSTILAQNNPKKRLMAHTHVPIPPHAQSHGL